MCVHLYMGVEQHKSLFRVLAQVKDVCNYDTQICWVLLLQLSYTVRS